MKKILIAVISVLVAAGVLAGVYIHFNGNRPERELSAKLEEAGSLLDSGNAQEALSAYVEARRLDPDNTQARDGADQAADALAAGVLSDAEQIVSEEKAAADPSVYTGENYDAAIRKLQGGEEVLSSFLVPPDRYAAVTKEREDLEKLKEGAEYLSLAGSIEGSAGQAAEKAAKDLVPFLLSEEDTSYYGEDAAIRDAISTEYGTESGDSSGEKVQIIRDGIYDPAKDTNQNGIDDEDELEDTSYEARETSEAAQSSASSSSDYERWYVIRYMDVDEYTAYIINRRDHTYRRYSDSYFAAGGFQIFYNWREFTGDTSYSQYLAKHGQDRAPVTAADVKALFTELATARGHSLYREELCSIWRDTADQLTVAGDGRSWHVSCVLDDGCYYRCEFLVQDGSLYGTVDEADVPEGQQPVFVPGEMIPAEETGQ